MSDSTHAFGIRIGYHEMEEQPLLGGRNLVNLAITLFVPIPAIACAVLCACRLR